MERACQHQCHLHSTQKARQTSGRFLPSFTSRSIRTEFNLPHQANFIAGEVTPFCTSRYCNSPIIIKAFMREAQYISEILHRLWLGLSFFAFSFGLIHCWDNKPSLHTRLGTCILTRNWARAISRTRDSGGWACHIVRIATGELKRRCTVKCCRRSTSTCTLGFCTSSVRV